MGEVYRAHDEKLQRDVAIKVLPASRAADPLAAGRLLREARAAAALNHPNICTVHEVGEHDGETFIAMELVEGLPLHRAVPDGIGLDADRVVDYGLQIAEALTHAHDRGVLHRDLKTANVLLTSSGRVKVLDFGLAKRIVLGPDALSESTSTSSTIGLQAGTPAYLAPEQLRGRPADARSDVWAFGVMLYELAAGQRPFEGDTLYELSAAILNAPPRPLPARVPLNLQHVIEGCLAKDPAQRIQSGEDVRRALQAIRDGASPARIVPPAIAARPRRVATPTVAAALAILALVAAATLALRGGDWRTWIGGSPRFDSIAVLPLDDATGGGDQAHVSVGIHQALTTELAQLQGFRKVVSTASTRRFANSQAPPTEIARTLDVKALVTGSIVRLGDELQVAAQLIDGADGREVWGQSYRRKANDVVALQNDVVTAIAQAIELRLRPVDRERLSARAKISPETYELYLRGMHAIRNADDGDAKVAGLDYFQQAIDRDPGDAHAYAGLAGGYAVLGHSPAAPSDAWIRARAAAERAITLAPDLAEAHTAMGQVKMYYEWDWDGAERAFRRANELNPNLAASHYHYAWLLFLFERLDEAIAEHERARDLDPLTPRNGAYLAPIYAAAGRHDEALAVVQKAIEMNPRSGLAWAMLGFVYSSLGRHDEAIEACRRAVGFAPPLTFTLGISYALAGRMDEAHAVLQTMLKRTPTAYGIWARSMLYLYLGDADGFFTAIAHEPHHGFAPWVRVEPPIARFKDDPRYAALFTRFKLPLPTAGSNSTARAEAARPAQE